MKTSNKLLLGFIIFVFLVPVCTSFVLKGLIKKNTYTTTLYPSAGYYQQGTFGAYKAVKIGNHPFPNGNDFVCTIRLSPSGKFLLHDYSGDEGLFDSVGVEIKRDTLYIQRFTIHSPGMQAAHKNAVAWADRNIDLFLPSLDNIMAERTKIKIDSSANVPVNIHLKDNASLVMGRINSNFKNVTVNAEQSSVLFGANVSIDSLWLYADDKSKIAFWNAPDVHSLKGSIDSQSINNTDSVTIKKLMPLVK